MAFGYRKWRDWRCEHFTNFKILTQAIMSSVLMRTSYFPFLFSALVDNYILFLVVKYGSKLVQECQRNEPYEIL
jgi:hypothetical protein